MPYARLLGVIIGKKNVILGKSARLNSEAPAPESFLDLLFHGFWNMDLLTMMGKSFSLQKYTITAQVSDSRISIKRLFHIKRPVIKVPKLLSAKYC